MFNRPLTVTNDTPEPKPYVPPVRRSYKPEETTITFNRNERNDIDYKGYKAYLYHFHHVTEVQDKEIYECIISAADMNEAIATFVADSVRGDDWYVDAEYNVEVIGVDLKVDRESKWVMELS